MKVQAVINIVASQHPFGVPSFMHSLDLEVMNTLEFSELANSGVLSVKDSEFAIGMEFSFRKIIIMEIRNCTISKKSITRENVVGKLNDTMEVIPVLWV
ncbi:hypothetical protein AHAS_Ahas13G0306900 [Arachis hypogaea]